MKTIILSDERFRQVLPSCILESELLSNDSKKVLAALINYYFVLDKVVENGYLFITNDDLRNTIQIRKSNMLLAINELIEFGLIEREVGQSRRKGEKATASRYTIIFDNLEKPLKKKNFKDLYNDFLKKQKSIKKPLGTVDIDVDVDKEIDIDLDLEIDIDKELEIEKELEKDKEREVENTNYFKNNIPFEIECNEIEKGERKDFKKCSLQQVEEIENKLDDTNFEKGMNKERNNNIFQPTVEISNTQVKEENTPLVVSPSLQFNVKCNDVNQFTGVDALQTYKKKLKMYKDSIIVDCSKPSILNTSKVITNESEKLKDITLEKQAKEMERKENEIMQLFTNIEEYLNRKEDLFGINQMYDAALAITRKQENKETFENSISLQDKFKQIERLKELKVLQIEQRKEDEEF